jgi:hypothetical protein
MFGLTPGAQIFCCHFSAGALRWTAMRRRRKKKVQTWVSRLILAVDLDTEHDAEMLVLQALELATMLVA